MDRTRITASVGFVTRLFKFVPIPLLIGSTLALFAIPEPEVGLVFLVVSLPLSGLFYFLAKRMGDIASLEYDEQTLYVQTRSGSYRTPLNWIQSIDRTDTRVNNQYLWRGGSKPGDRSQSCSAHRRRCGTRASGTF